MPKLVLPAIDPSKIEIRQYSVGTARHVRALARYLYQRIPSNVARALIVTLVPHLNKSQVDNVMNVRLRNLQNMTLKQIKEIMKGA